MTKIVELQTFYNSIDQSSNFNDNQYGHFNIFKIDEMKLPKYRRASYTRRSFYKVTLVYGQSKIHYADRDIEVNGWVLVLTNPNIQYHWEMISEQQSGYMCIFNESFFRRHNDLKEFLVLQSADTAVLELSKAQALEYEFLFVKMFNEIQGRYKYKYNLLRCLLMEIIHEAQKTTNLPQEFFIESNAAERISASFMEIMERQFPIELTYQVVNLSSPVAFAKHLNIHVNHLNKALKTVRGRTTSQLINERILQEAKILLRCTNWTIGEIAFSLGFGEANHFSTFFKGLANITARNYRELTID